MTIRIGVLSDTHGLLRPQVIARLQGCDCVIHAGDINRPELLEQLQAIAPLYVVRGNNDKQWASLLPQTLRFSVGGVHFFLVHNKKEVPKDLAGVNVVIFGHSHRYFEQWVDGRLWLNPGSCGRRRFDQEITMAILTLDGQSMQVQKLVFSPEGAC